MWIELMISRLCSHRSTSTTKASLPQTQEKLPYAPKQQPTKEDLQDLLDSVEKILDGAYVPEASREDLVGTVADALDALRGHEADEDEEIKKMKIAEIDGNLELTIFRPKLLRRYFTLIKSKLPLDPELIMGQTRIARHDERDDKESPPAEASWPVFGRKHRYGV